MKRIDLYSILIRNGFKAPDTNKLMFFRGYVYCYFRDVMELDDRDVWEKIAIYSDDEWRKLLNRLKNNGHVIR